MSCCSPNGKGVCMSMIAPCLARLAFGLVLVGYGINHYRNLEMFRGMASGVYTTVPVVAQIAGLLAYIVPALMIVGGVLFAVKQLCWVSKICIVASLSGIIGWAALAVLLGDANAGGSMMPLIQNAAILFILYGVIKKMGCGPKMCCTGAAHPAGCTCEKCKMGGSCGCK